VARDFALERLRALEPRVARVELALSPPDAAIAIDGRPVNLPVANGVPVLPGERTITATRDGYRSSTETLTLTAGERRTVELTLTREPVAVIPAPVVPEEDEKVLPPVAAPPSRWRPMRTWGIGVGSLGLASLVVGAGMASLTASIQDSGNRPALGMMWDSSLPSRGETSQALTIAFFSVGGVATAAGLVIAIVATVAERRRH